MAKKRIVRWDEVKSNLDRLVDRFPIVAETVADFAATARRDLGSQDVTQIQRAMGLEACPEALRQHLLGQLAEQQALLLQALGDNLASRHAIEQCGAEGISEEVAKTR